MTTSRQYGGIHSHLQSCWLYMPNGQPVVGIGHNCCCDCDIVGVDKRMDSNSRRVIDFIFNTIESLCL